MSAFTTRAINPSVSTYRHPVSALTSGFSTALTTASAAPTTSSEITDSGSVPPEIDTLGTISVATQIATAFTTTFVSSPSMA